MLVNFGDLAINTDMIAGMLSMEHYNARRDQKIKDAAAHNKVVDITRNKKKGSAIMLTNGIFYITSYTLNELTDIIEKKTMEESANIFLNDE